MNFVPVTMRDGTRAFLNMDIVALLRPTDEGGTDVFTTNDPEAFTVGEKAEDLVQEARARKLT